MFNTAYMIAVVSNIGEEAMITGGVKRSIIGVRCYDGSGKISSARVMLSELSELRRSTGLNIGDVIFFSASLSEGTKDMLVFHPHDIYVLRKNQVPIEDDSQKVIDSRLLPYKKDRNVVVFEGRVTAVEKEHICISTENLEALRGDSSADYHIWVVNTEKASKAVKVGNKVTFVGEISKGVLKGKVFS